jgi:hypothetical protein
MLNIETFNKLFNSFAPSQQREEWRGFLEFVGAYFSNRGIVKPIVVEIGIEKNRQKLFYEGILNAEHIGIDIHKDLNPDIAGDSHNAGTVMLLEERLKGRQIDLLFIDASHLYESVKEDYRLYEPLTRHIVAFHDAMTVNKQNPSTVEVKRLWGEIMRDERRYLKVLFSFKPDWMGIGLIIKG